ncbi:hypothetical protein V6N11_035643 [Hibiscus sabdariffa]|uniref:Uncharacterized protein n=2 Tax=Hibiscus sabdariffa TaxID=183260 RepID=A0ABR1ZRS7_9ROSI
MVPKTAAANFSHPLTMAIVDHVADAESSNKSTKPIGDNTNGNLVDATNLQLPPAIDSPMESNMAATSKLSEPNIPMIISSNVTVIKQTEDIKDAISYAPMTLTHNSQSIGLNGSTLTPTTTPFDESNEFLDFLANLTEANGDILSLYDNLGLEPTVVTTLPIPTEEELEKDMGKSFLATPSMLIVFDD